MLSFDLSLMFVYVTAILALDQGSSGTRCIVADPFLKVLGQSAAEVGVSYPRPGWVEQDPLAYVSTTMRVASEALEMSGLSSSDVAAIGIANQTETFVVWERETGDPIYPAISWQCTRSTDRYERLVADGHSDKIRKITGLKLDPSFPATKLGWVLDNVDGARAAAINGRLAYGDVASWLLWNMTGGSVHITESSNAARTMLVDLGRLEWDVELLELFDIPAQILPEIVASDGIEVRAVGDPWNDVPVSAALGDQQAALFGQQCWDEGMAKLTLGTGGFLWQNAGHEGVAPPDGILGTCAWRMHDDITYALEAFVPSAGSVVEWLRSIGFISDVSELQTSSGSDANLDRRLCFVPALQGLGSPAWDADVRGTVLGMSAATSRADLIGAAMDGVAQLICDAIEAMGDRDRVIRVDGGMASNDSLMQKIADLSGVSLERPERPDATALGIAGFAGLASGFWSSPDELRDAWELDRRFSPSLTETERAEARQRWKGAVELARAWAE